MRRLFLPIRTHVYVAATRPTLGAHGLAGKRRDLGVVGILRHVDQTLVSARIVEASGDEVLHAEVAHVTERHRRAGRVLGFIR